MPNDITDWNHPWRVQVRRNAERRDHEVEDEADARKCSVDMLIAFKLAMADDTLADWNEQLIARREAANESDIRLRAEREREAGE